MAAGNGRSGRPPHKHSKTAVAQPGDEQCTWSRERLEKMDARFTRKLEWAFRQKRESRASAAAQVELPTSGAPHFSAPLCPDIWTALLRSNAPSVTDHE